MTCGETGFANEGGIRVSLRVIGNNTVDPEVTAARAAHFMEVQARIGRLATALSRPIREGNLRKGKI